MEKENIVLIGMSGAGKTTIGKLLSEKLDMDFLDTDEIIENDENRKIKDIFANEGEVFFRNLETECAKKVAKLKKVIISTGGGMILKEENMDALKESGVVIYLKRSVESIKKSMDTSNRPLLRDGLSKLYEMEKQRAGLYEKYADFIALNEGKEEETIDNIISFIENK